MKCPKCGYNSFEFLNACKKCGSELGSFKKTHNISPIVLPIATVAAEPPRQAASPDVNLESDQLFAATPPTQDADNAVLQDTRDAAPPAQQENPYAGFDLDFPDSAQDQAGDQAFNEFSFSDQPADMEPESTMTLTDATDDGFSFGEYADEAQPSAIGDFQFDEPESDLEDYERILEPDSFGSSEPLEGAMPQEAEEIGQFGTSDFDFATGAATEDIFGLENEPDTPVAPEKKAQQNVEDFDKEFEMIFSFEDAEESEKNT
ncbi:MAG: hypothetical protein PHO83_00755 [Geobacteraceae bacterium]|nr:hypothetical protein [Geobacteraceae bacterium]